MKNLPNSVGTIGAGNMAEAILEGLLRAGMSADQLIASDPDPGRQQHITSKLGIRTTQSNAEVAGASEVTVLAVKPDQLERASADLPQDGGGLYLSIVAGRRLATLRRLLGASARIVRAMPNTPALIAAGISAVAREPDTSEADLARAEATLSAVGRVVHVPESALDAVTGLSGSGPAYVYVFIEALAEAGVREGLPLETAHELAVETVLGAARLVRESGEHPALLRERVSSPGGTTLAGLAALDKAGLRSAVFGAVQAATARSREIAADPK